MSTTKCAAFWQHTNIRSGGRIYPCCRFKTPIAQFDGDLSNVIHSQEYKELRELSSAGEKIHGCEKCYYEESIQHKSLRQEFNEKYSTEFIDLKYLEIGLDNLCNLTCDGCNSEFSTSWIAKEIKLKGKADYGYRTVGEINNIPEELTEILFLGGEPLITKAHLDLLKKIEVPQNVKITYNTNAMFTPDQECIDMFDKFLKVKFIVSIDGVGSVAETVRGGTKWNQVVAFIEWVKEKGYHLEFNTVVHKNNWHDIENIFNFCNQYNDKWYINVLTYPTTLDVCNISNKDKEKFIATVKRLDLPNKDFILNHINATI